jgi:hypothetical protein
LGKKSKHEILSRHHIVPSTRGGPNGEFNIIYPPRYLHAAYHTLFANSIPEEVAKQLDDYFNGKNDKFLYSSKNRGIKKKKAYECLFGNMSKEEIEDYLKTDWFDALTSKYRYE